MNARHLADLLEESSRRFADRVAVVDDRENQLTYAELNRRADAIAAALSAGGVRRGDRVGVVMPKTVSAVAALFGVLKAGAAYVPIDPAAPAARGQNILTDCNVRGVIVDHRLAAVVPSVDAAEELEVVVLDGPKRSVADLPGSVVGMSDVLDARGTPPAVEREPTDLAYILYTSGSTGMPKGVMITHDNVLAFLAWCSATFKPSELDRFSGFVPFHFDPSVLDLYLSITHGATVFLLSHDAVKAPEEVARFIARHRLTILHAAPSLLCSLLRFGKLESHDASSLRLVLFGGEVFPIKHLRDLQRAWRSPAYYNLYGPTETTVACAYASIPSPVPQDRNTPFPIGFACHHCQAVVLDRDGREAKWGEEGILHIRGRSVFAGYWGRPQDTRAALVEHGGHQWYCTGDVVRFDPSQGLTYVGRNDRMVKRRGHRIELGEIEHALYGHAAVREAAAIALADAESGVTIVGYLVLEQGRTLSTVELKAFCAKTLPAYMIPDRFVVRDRLSRTSTDKVDYQALIADWKRVA